MRHKCVCALAALLTLPAWVRGETPRTQLSLNYSSVTLRVSGESTGMPIGWNAAAIFSVTDSLGIVLDAGGNYRTESDEFEGVDFDATLKEHTVQAGIRWSSFGNATITPWIQGLAGLSMLTASVEVLGESEGDTVTDFMVQPGVGVDVKIGDSATLGVALDYGWVFGEGETFGVLRVRGGVTFRFGQR